ncbi:MAG: beta-propeller domain-containing protein [Candidatus Bathyarchaeia archaeon]
MQKQISRRTKLYGIAAVLLATILVSLIYQFGYVPRTSPTQPSSAMLAFSSYEELTEFLQNNTQPQSTYPSYESSVPPSMLPATPFALASPSVSANSILSYQGEITGTTQYSTTNIQVAGVDEADTVKTDGEYIYLVTGNNVSILKAYPADQAQLVSTIATSDMTPVGIFVNGDRLAVLGTQSIMSQQLINGTDVYFTNTTTTAQIYDISNRTNPKLLTTFTTSGSYFSSRMIGDFVYLIASEPAFYADQPAPNVTIDTVNIPKLGMNGNTTEVPPSEIYYSNTTDNYFVFTTIIALNIQDTAETPSYKTLTLGGTSTIYVSLNNIYITFPEQDQTLIYRVHIENSTINPEAKGEVPGSVLNQYSMDEYNDCFRIATTNTTWTTSTINVTGTPIVFKNANGTLSITNTTGPFVIVVRTAPATEHNVYVLDQNLTILGRLENIAPNENLYSARFVGDRCYLVTFQKTDPLFVINLTDPTEPAVLGQLLIPGFSDYLYPYDENHLIGVGKETVEADQGYFAWYQGIKVALFDVSNVSNPIQMANYTIGDRGSDSPVLSDPKAFLFDKSKNLLVIPVLVAKIDQSQYPNASAVPPSAYGQPIWQGAYVFNLTLSEGFVFRGGITHIENGTSISDSNYYVQRSLYIENVLYTVSNAMVKLNSLDDLAFIKEIEIG